MSKELRKKIEKFNKKYPEIKSNVIRNGKHVIIDLGLEKLKPNFKTSGDEIIRKRR